ncbi:MAG: hydrogenase nickel incorporation protein HypB [Cyclobacteriaceae bacterium]|nr:hydrogenase nickel incorporation protein HypB [Cyclobacteriaceae bacterium]
MCSTCGCGGDDTIKYIVPNQKESDSKHELIHEHTHSHGHDHHYQHHDHAHDHHGNGSVLVDIEKDILQKNNVFAAQNRGFFMGRNVLAINMVSSPGSGKTALLEKLIPLLKEQVKVYVVEGDQSTTRDAERIERTGASVIQINTGKTCHLDAHMIIHAIEKLQPESNSVLFIENVGNLVCPALFDLGETWRMVIMSVTEGEDKPLKYPYMFESSQYCVLNKIDLLPYVPFDMEQAKDYLKKIRPELQIMETSALKGDGVTEMAEMILQKVNN